ncbi:uncharacterized protein LOC127698874 isoform X2 [Mytilus californianus]|uniref:uncharacterized protein LOC127698874 isoform X2 n=1 Tax=Mytilus californianus TaxID=6549 RepID=UPI002247B5D9|nr:uncharacterized protein LOC127698874 isoform X2 [Mytilus californianus]
MRNLPPNSPDLPVTRNMPFTTKSVPSKAQPRNMTGIYLGLEGNIKPPTVKTTVGISPLARGRRISNRIRTPTEQRRYRLVEQLRIKEESRGFVGQPLKQHLLQRKQPVVSTENSNSSLSPRSQTAKQWGPAKHANRNDFYDLIRTNPRNFTVVVNNGVTRSENLSGLASYDEGNNSDGMYAEALADEVTKISTHDVEDSALEDCFRHVCKGKVENMQTLLPYRKTQQLNRSQTAFSTGFTVRSYRNPKSAEIMANFNQTGRPKTVPSQPSRPLVPSPYFFRYYSNPYTKYSLSAKNGRTTPSSKFENQFQSLNGTSKIMAAQGAGALSRSIKTRSAWSETDFRLHGKLHGQGLFYRPSETDIQGTPRDNKDEDSIQETGKPVHISMKVGDDCKMTDSDQKKDDIHFGVSDEHGKECEVEIDAPEEEQEEVIPFRGKVRKASITDKVEKSRISQAYIDTIKEDAEHRKKELEKMLNEHQEIVQEIGRSSSRDNLAEDNRDH